MLTYTPNSGFVGEDNMFQGSFNYSDDDQDVAQSVIELSDPKGQLVVRSDPEPVMGGNQITGSADFMLMLDKSLITQIGLYHFSVWVVDLFGRESNHLAGELRFATRAPYDPNSNP